MRMKACNMQGTRDLRRNRLAWKATFPTPTPNLTSYIPLTLYPRRGSGGISRHSSETPTFYYNYLAMKNTADVSGGKLIAV
jgi:hypothetical protein